MSGVLIIAYGNPLRSDDGLAWLVAEQLENRFRADDVEILRLHQLGPELAETASHAACVIFIDAANSPGSPGEIQIADLSASTALQPAHFGHAISPATVLGLAAQLYSAKPRAYSATIVGQSFDHGDTLSATVIQAIPQLLSEIERLVRQNLRYSVAPSETSSES